MTFDFEITPEFIALAEHSAKHTQWYRHPYTGGNWKTPEKKVEGHSLMLVKDIGVYLMSPFTIEDACVPEDAQLKNGSSMFCCYARGLRKDVHIGGDDFAEIVSIPEGYQTASLLRVKLTPETIESILVDEKPKRAKKGK
jgi:hypothetical protein